MFSWRILHFLPRRALSRFIGVLARAESPRFIIQFVIQMFQTAYGINLNEAEKPLSEYKSLNEFFTRKLKTGLRPIQEGFAVHPADSRISRLGVIDQGTLIQAKGITYELSEFIGDAEKASRYEKGAFLVYYLCPTDYHRVHSPVEGLIKDIKRLGADLWPVHDESVVEIPQLFIRNERVVVSLQTQLGPVEVVFVGATNVGSIEIFKSVGDVVRKGEELGVFQFGSTVVMIYPKEVKVATDKIKLEPVLVGQTLLRLETLI
ncbi:MAG: archaetidylserine decarboxylase [Bdellovibrionales bacterium]